MSQRLKTGDVKWRRIKDRNLKAGFGTKLRDFRFKFRITQREMAQWCGVHITTYAHWEIKDRMPYTHNWKKIIILLDKHKDTAGWRDILGSTHIGENEYDQKHIRSIINDEQESTKGNKTTNAIGL